MLVSVCCVIVQLIIYQSFNHQSCHKRYISDEDNNGYRYTDSLIEFKPDSEKIEAYLEHVQLFFAANGITDNKKVPELLTVIGSPTYLCTVKQSFSY